MKKGLKLAQLEKQLQQSEIQSNEKLAERSLALNQHIEELYCENDELREKLGIAAVKRKDHNKMTAQLLYNAGISASEVYKCLQAGKNELDP